MTSDQRTSWRLYVVPRFLLNAGSLHGLKRKVGGSAEFAAIERKEDNRELMMLQEVIALDEQLLSRKPSWVSTKASHGASSFQGTTM
jgi:hypothetical protein